MLHNYRVKWVFSEFDLFHMYGTASNARPISNCKWSRNLPNTDVRELQYRFALTSEAPSMLRNLVVHTMHYAVYFIELKIVSFRISYIINQNLKN